MNFLLRIGLFLLLLAPLACKRDSGGSTSSEVVLYSSIDEPYLAPLAKRFEQKTGIKVRVVTDTEATKSAGLAERLEAEREHPQADVFWGNEIFHTINLAERGLFSPYRPATGNNVPARWRAKNDLYTGIGLRARMIGVSTRPDFKDLPTKIHGLNDLTDPAFRGKIGMSNPAFGTAGGHIAALYVVWGEAKFTQYIQGLRGNEIKLLGGNSAVADQIAAGNLIAGLTDNDDINNLKVEKHPIEGILPDQGEADPGTLLIPSTIALTKGAPHPENAKKLIDFLNDPAIERELIERRFFACSVRDQGQIKAMDVDYVEAAHGMKRAVETALKILQER